MTFDLVQILDYIPSLIMLVAPATAFNIAYHMSFEKIHTSVTVLTFVGSFILSLPFMGIPNEGVWVIFKPIFAISLSLFLGFGLFLIGKSSTVMDKFFVQKLKHNCVQNVWDGIEDTPGCFVTIFLTNSDFAYCGAYYKHFYQNNESWVVITEYTVYKRDPNELFLDNSPVIDYTGDKTRHISFNTKYIENFQIQYGEDSAKIQPEAKK